MKRNLRAFTLMELLVSCTLLATVIGLSAGLLLSASRYLKKSRTQLLRNYVAEKVMEDIIEAGFTGVDALPKTGFLQMEAKLRERTQRIAFRYTISVVEVSPNLKSVLLSVGQGSGKEVSYETFLTDFL